MKPTEGEHTRIWLEPKGAPDRCWCSDNQWGDEGVEYVNASTLESVQRENERMKNELKSMRDRYEKWMPMTENLPAGMHPYALLEFYCIRDQAEDEESCEYWKTGTWDEKPVDAVFWCAIVSPLGPHETTFIAS